MRTILIIYPHFPPSNLAGVHRPRLFAQHLPEFGWEPIILTVKEKFYEEKLDENLVKLLPAGLHIEKVNARPVSSVRMIGDIGLRAFSFLYTRALEIIQSRKIDFIYIPVPSFYVALLGNRLYKKTKIPYGIDYIDPWVHSFPGSNKIFSRHWVATQIAKWLEPIAVRNASLITGVAEGYYLPVLERNPKLRTHVVYGAMPYGGEEADHIKVKELGLKPYLFQHQPDKITFVYAGAMLPKAYKPLEEIFISIQHHPDLFKDVVFHFIGTGKSPNDPEGFNIKPLAEKYGLWHKNIFEYPARIPYLDVLVHLEAADAIFILGSTEPHYTPSKTYQGVLSKKPLFAVLHKKSTAAAIITASNAGRVISFEGEKEVSIISKKFAEEFKAFKAFQEAFSPEAVNQAAFKAYSAKNVTGKLVALLNKAVNKNIQE